MKKVSVIINARLSSTRVPNKLLRPFANSTLFEIALNKISQISFADNLYVGIGDDQLIEIANNYKNIQILRRDPQSIAKGTHLQKVTFDHYKHVETDYIFIINPCQPLLSLSTLEMAFETFQNTNFKSYTSVVSTGDWIFDRSGKPLTNTDKDNVTTNKDVSFYKASHSFHIIDKNLFLKNGYHWEFIENDPALIPISNSEIYDVDEENEFLVTEYMYKKNNNLI